MTKVKMMLKGIFCVKRDSISNFDIYERNK